MGAGAVLMAFLNFWALQSSWVRGQTGGLGKISPSAGTTKIATRAWRFHSGGWQLVVDVSDPGTASAPFRTAYSLVEGPGQSHASVSWSVQTDNTQPNYWWNVIVSWYRNGTLTQVDSPVAQSVGGASSPRAPTVWSVGDVVHCTMRYQSSSFVNGPESGVSPDVTLTSGTSGG